MNKKVYSNIEFTDLINRINHEIQRRGTYKWFDPLTIPSVGIDKSLPLSIPGNEVYVDDKTYSINNPSEGSIEPTRNITHPAHGFNPAGQLPDDNPSKVPNTSAAELNVDELKNLLVGLSKIEDINLFYGREELTNTAFRDPQGIEDVLVRAENSELNALLHESDLSPTKNDPNGGLTDRMNDEYPVNHDITYPIENGIYVMPSGESDGEEITSKLPLGPGNFYDDYGAQPGDANFHPTNRFVSEMTNRDWHDQDNDRKTKVTRVRQGGLSSKRFGLNPRNPEEGDPYISRPVYGGKESSCMNLCVGLCFGTCDNECSEGCSTTCFARCGEQCTANCGNQCTGCSSQCYTTCRTKCENRTGYSCVKSGSKAIKITSENGKNKVETEYHTCVGCSYSCQFYPNKKTECWDAGCMGKCFTSCSSSCSDSCSGGCIGNKEEYSELYGYKQGKGQGCEAACTLNCIGTCSTVCEGYCVHTCFNTCKSSCSDNCAWKCETTCGSGCENGCKMGCTGCQYTCVDGAKNRTLDKSCTGCSFANGCMSACQSDCNHNCIGIGCKSICGADGKGACDANCRMSCMATSCTAMCSDACSSRCTACVGTCGNQCGACSGICASGCEAECNINCSKECEHNCSLNCTQSCSEVCGGCSGLCYSCVGKCIGICSVKCEAGCSSCAGLCSYWCDSSCNRACFGDCSHMCLRTCTGTCATMLMSEADTTEGPERDPTAVGYIYPHPKNRWEERESFRLVNDIPPYRMPAIEPNMKLITISYVGSNKIDILEVSQDRVEEEVLIFRGSEDGFLATNNKMIPIKDILQPWRYKYGKYHKITIEKMLVNNLIYLWDRDRLGNFNPDDIPSFRDKDHNIIVSKPTNLTALVKQSTLHGGIYTFDEDGNPTINTDVLENTPPTNRPNLDKGGEIFMIELYFSEGLKFTTDDIAVDLPWGFELLPYKIMKDKIIVSFQRNRFLFPEEVENGKDNTNTIQRNTQ